jgi:hypothetical protein
MKFQTARTDSGIRGTLGSGGFSLDVVPEVLGRDEEDPGLDILVLDLAGRLCCAEEMRGAHPLDWWVLVFYFRIHPFREPGQTWAVIGWHSQSFLSLILQTYTSTFKISVLVLSLTHRNLCRNHLFTFYKSRQSTSISECDGSTGRLGASCRIYPIPTRHSQGGM